MLWLRAAYGEMGYALECELGSDSTAGIGVASRLGCGKLRHVEGRYLWLQEKVRAKELILKKIPTEDNRADMQTKPLDSKRFQKLMATLPLRVPPQTQNTAAVTMIEWYMQSP